MQSFLPSSETSIQLPASIQVNRVSAHPDSCARLLGAHLNLLPAPWHTAAILQLATSWLRTWLLVQQLPSLVATSKLKVTLLGVTGTRAGNPQPASPVWVSTALQGAPTATSM